MNTKHTDKHKHFFENVNVLNYKLEIKDNILISLFMDIPTKTSVREERKTGTILARAIEVEQGRYNIAKYLKFESCGIG